jgi:hypothetical protein
VAGTQPTPAVLAVEEIENLRARAAASMAAAETATASRADLVIFVNTAAAATQSIQLIDLFGGDRLRYQPSAAPETKIEAADNAGDPPMPLDALDRPLFVSITSTVDAVTKLAMPIGHGIQYYALEATGSFRDNHPLQCFDPFKDGAQSWTLNSAAEGARRQRAFYMITAPHLAALESHWMLKATGKDQMRVSSTGEIVKVKDALAISKCDAGLFDKDMHVTSTFRLPGSETCYAIQERPNRCNGTPYWAMEVDPDVLYDHSDIFTDRFITFLIETFFQTPTGPLTRKNPVLLQETP